MRLKTFCELVIISTVFWLEASPAGLQWNPGKFGKITEREGKQFLTVQVPPKDKNALNCATATIDLTPHQGNMLRFRIMARAKNVSIPKHYYNGVKFMLRYTDATGLEHWHNCSKITGSFPWRELTFTSSIDITAKRGTMCLGLQESSGQVEFDLSSLKIENLFSPNKSDHQAVYTDRIRNTPPLRGVMSPSKEFTEDDWKTLQQWNVNLVRAQIIRRWGQYGSNRNLKDYDEWLASKLDHFEKMFHLGYTKYGLRFVIDLHSPPGGRLKNGTMAMCFEKKYADHFVKTWQQIAMRFKGNPAIWAYDLLNEPSQTCEAPLDYWNLQRMAAEAIREIDPDTPIIIQSNHWDHPDAFVYLRPLELKDIIYEVHMYMPGTFTHQLVGNTFGVKGNMQKVSYPDTVWNKEMLRNVLVPVRTFQKKHNARIFVGEFSAPIWAPGAEKYLADCISLFEEYGWDWTYHAFREWKGWSLEHEGDWPNQIRPSTDNPRKRVLLREFQKNIKNSPLMEADTITP